MNLKTLSISVLILAVLSATAAWINRPVSRSESDPRVGQSLLADVLANETNRLSLSGSDGAVELSKTDGAWRVDSYYNLPADESKLRRLVQELAEAKIARVVTRNPERAARLELGETTVVLEAGGTATNLIFGKNAERGGRYLKYAEAEDSPVYLTPASTALDTSAKNWANSALTGFTATDIKQIEIGFGAEAALTVTRESADSDWNAAGLTADQQLRSQPVTTLLNQLSGLRFTETAAPDHADVRDAQANSRTITFTSFDDQSVGITLGRRPEQIVVKEGSPSIEGDEVNDALEDSTETIPAGAVYVSLAGDTSLAPLAFAQTEIAFEIADYLYSGLPANRSALIETVAPASSSD